MLTAKEISARLATRVEDVCHYLLPAGRKIGGNWRIGNTAGGPGDSVGIQVSGSKAGIWSDFASGSETEKGDLLDLWAACRNIPLGQAFKEAKEWLGLASPVAANPAKDYKRPKATGIISIRKETIPPVENYLINERKLSRNALISYRVGCKSDFHGPGGMAVAFPIINASGDLLNVKYLGLERTVREDGKIEKHVSQGKECAPALFGWQVIDKSAKEILICEGEIDAMTWWDFGFTNALSVPSGAGNLEWIDYEWDNIEVYDRIYLSFDMDKAGEEAVIKIAHRLGLYRCFIVKLPEKDANACLIEGYDGGHAAGWIKAARAIAPKEIKQTGDFLDQAVKLISPEGDQTDSGLRTPIFGRRFRFRPGEMTLWTGHTSHGKTTLLNQILIYAVREGQKVAMGSFEMSGARLLIKFTSCLALANDLTVDMLSQTCNWMADKVWIYDMMGIVKRNRLMELMEYSVMRHGVAHIVIDSLMKCDLSSEDYEEQRKFINDLHCFAIEKNVHVHLVGHPRKADSDKDAPGTMDVHGGQSVVGQPDNIIAVWRNRDKESKREDNKLTEHLEKTTPDTIAFVRKQRATGDEYKVWLWFHRKWNRFTTNHGEKSPEYEDFGIITKQPTEEQSE